MSGEVWLSRAQKRAFLRAGDSDRIIQHQIGVSAAGIRRLTDAGYWERWHEPHYGKVQERFRITDLGRTALAALEEEAW